jgi:hypothetical protein
MSCWCDGDDPGCTTCHPNLTDAERARARRLGARDLRQPAETLDEKADRFDPNMPPAPEHLTRSDDLPPLWRDSAYRLPTCSSSIGLRVLPELYGRPWDVRAMNLIDALRPSRVRVSAGELKTDSFPWRVTVMLDGAGLGIIKWIEQEVTVGLRGGFENGHDYDVRYLRSAAAQPMGFEAGQIAKWIDRLADKFAPTAAQVAAGVASDDPRPDLLRTVARKVREGVEWRR